jgi:hypothetical protein
MALVQVTGTNFYRDTESMGLVNRDKNGLDEYNTKRKILLAQKDEINNMKKDINSIKDDMTQIKDLLLKLMDKE